MEFEIFKNYLKVFFIITSINGVRYFIFAGLGFLIFWKVLKKKINFRRIQPKDPKKEDIKREIIYSMSTVSIFGFVGVLIYTLKQAGYTKIYSDFHQYSLGYFLFSLLLLIFLHDTYFYWIHRLMHHPKIYKYVHYIHHKSHNPTPFAAFSFHPLEAILESAIIPISVFLIPLHNITLFVFLTFSLFMNVLGHLGYEIYFKNFTKHPLTWWNNTSTHHNMHHRFVNYNFGLYFNLWDRIMGTNHPKYFEFYEKVTEVPLLFRKSL